MKFYALAGDNCDDVYYDVSPFCILVADDDQIVEDTFNNEIIIARITKEEVIRSYIGYSTEDLLKCTSGGFYKYPEMGRIEEPTEWRQTVEGGKNRLRHKRQPFALVSSELSILLSGQP